MKWLKDKLSITPLGKGVSGTVELHEKGDDRFIVKTYHEKESFESRREFKSRVLYEYHLLSSLNHKNIIHVLGCKVSLSGLKIKIYMEAGSPDLSAILRKYERDLSIGVLISLWKQVCEAVAYLHGRGLCHRDLKLENIVMNESLTEVKLIDFMTATKCETTVVGIVGSSRYMAPEMASQISYDGKCADLWSLGIILYRFLHHKFPWRQAVHSDPDFKVFQLRQDTADSFSQFDRETSNHGSQDTESNLEYVSQSCIELLPCLLREKPSERYNINELLETRWLKAIDSRIDVPIVPEQASRNK